MAVSKQLKILCIVLRLHPTMSAGSSWVKPFRFRCFLMKSPTFFIICSFMVCSPLSPVV